MDSVRGFLIPTFFIFQFFYDKNSITVFDSLVPFCFLLTYFFESSKKFEFLYFLSVIVLYALFLFFLYNFIFSTGWITFFRFSFVVIFILIHIELFKQIKKGNKNI